MFRQSANKLKKVDRQPTRQFLRPSLNLPNQSPRQAGVSPHFQSILAKQSQIQCRFYIYLSQVS